jgi:multidrug efflux pump subunit AcrA (membrane-fusion protein)
LQDVVSPRPSRKLADGLLLQPQAVERLKWLWPASQVEKHWTLVTTQPARIEALEQAPVHSKIAAYVGEVLVDYGDKVKKGQPMIKLVAPELDAAVSQKKALLEKSHAQQAQRRLGRKRPRQR